ncbi:MAG: tetraacyldisaccharide 4'-kinase [Pirellulales bacterium]|nr:tetraacyldisaccharide 4'-kinase [Pirellulales bacterium]
MPKRRDVLAACGKDALFSAAEFRALVSGEQKGLRPALARAVLSAAEFPYRAVVGWRNRRFDAGVDVQRLSVPVVSVGNLTLGGTGKTPLVEWIARWYRRRGVRVALVSRGYKAHEGGYNDEALELEQKLPDVPHVQNRDRVAAARMAIEEFESQLILLDDGFQHRRLARDLDIVVLDALEPFGFDHVFPRGTLREPSANLARAQVVVLSRADQVDAAARSAIRERARQHAPPIAWIEARHAPARLSASSGGQQTIDWLMGRRVAAFCGLGNPRGFQQTLASLGCELIALREFPDHHNYIRDDVDGLAHWASKLNVEAVLTTHKDLVKLRLDQLGGVPLWALIVELQILSGEDELIARLAPLSPPPDD